MGTALEIIEWFDPTGDIMIQRIPPAGAADIKFGAQLIVRESQKAIFFRDGKALDVFSAGRHTLTTMNIPLLTKLLSLPFGFKSPFQAEVVFVNMKDFIGLKWGTPNPVTFRDSVFQMVRLRGFGVFSIKITGPSLFVNKIVGTQGIFTTDGLNSYLKELIVSRLTDLLGETMGTVLDLPRYYDELAAGLKARTAADFQKMGIELLDLLINSITPPEEVQKMIDERSGMGAVGDLNAYMKFKSAKAIEESAKASGEGGSSMSAGMGLGMGAAMGAMFPEMMKNAAGAQQSGAIPGGSTDAPAGSGVFCPQCGNRAASGDKFCSKCGNKIQSSGLICGKCNTQNMQGSAFCSNCGNKL